MPSRKNTKPKDSKAPKKPLTSYFIFANKRRPQLKEENKDKKITQLSKLISAEWRTMKPEEKSKYEQEAQKLKEQYNKDLEEYKTTQSYREYQKKLQEWKNTQDSNGKSSRGGKKSAIKSPGKKPKDPNAPKKYSSSYFIFASEKRKMLKEKHSDKKVTELAKMVGEMWRNLTKEEKKPYEDKAAIQREEYEKKYEEYKKTPQYTEYTKILQKYENDRKNYKKRQNANQSESEENNNNDNGSSSSGSDSSGSSGSESSGSSSSSDSDE